ncbi:MAG TPA: APC family permease [Terriglobales bacterium]|nr:APC family permease [Terriglobales bacterium]
MADQSLMSPPQQPGARRGVQVFVATSVMLSFISFWRAAAIVLNDLGSSAYYVGGDTENIVGRSAPWFVLAVMLFSYAVRALYIESSAMFVRGGVYRVVKEAMGGTLAKFSVSALLFDYILTAPISAVAAGMYLAGFFKDVGGYVGHTFTYNDNYFAAAFAILIEIYFWWKNIQGIHESSDKAMKIMKITTVMVVILIVWSVYTIARLHAAAPAGCPNCGHLPPLPSVGNFAHVGGEWKTKEAFGWLQGTWVQAVFPLILLIGFGHAVLAMSGEETLAQVNREIESPKLKNLKRTGFIIFIYSLLFTSLVSFFASMIIPDAERPKFFGNLIAGVAMNFAGPGIAKLIFHGFVVLVGVLMLAGAVNTAVIGANGVLNRVAEDGVLTSWFQRPHSRYGTTYRIINLIVVLQIATILFSGGNVFILAALYAFGVIWSFSFKSLAVLVLRFTEANVKREWRVPLNMHIGRIEIPIGLGIITLVLFAVAILNLFTKPDATVAGVGFSLVFFAIFSVSEHYTHKHRAAHENIEQFRVTEREDLDDTAISVRPGNTLVAVRDPRNLGYLQQVLHTTDTTQNDVVVMTARLYHREHSFSGSSVMEAKDVFDLYEQELFTHVVTVAEKEGKPVHLLVVPGTNVFDTIVATAQRLQSSKIVSGLSQQLTADEQGKFTGDAWERLPEPRSSMTLEIVAPQGEIRTYELGPHTPRLRKRDLVLVHDVWLKLTAMPEFRKLHHYHVISVAVQRMRADLESKTRDQVIDQLRDDLDKEQD